MGTFPRLASNPVAAWILLCALAVPVAAAPLPTPTQPILLHRHRASAGDLALGGDVAGVPPGSVLYLRYDDLLRLPQTTYTIDDDPNFHGQTVISGIPLSQLAHLYGKPGASDLIVALCYDLYRSNYPSNYIRSHHPLLVLRINGQLRDHWPPSEYGGSMGPYLISHPTFTPSFAILSHQDEMQIPFGVTEIDFRSQTRVFGAIRPPGHWPSDSTVWQGYLIAQQDCFRCHNSGPEGGRMAQRDWRILSAWAATNTALFTAYIHSPTSVMASAKMPAHTSYDAATLHVLTRYFQAVHPCRSQIPGSQIQ